MVIARILLTRVSIALCVLGLVALTAGCSEKESSTPESQNDEVAQYLKGAELQVETTEQRGEIVRALEDLRTLKPEALKQKRYADYSMTPGKWTLPELLQRYYVPASPRSINEDALYADAQRDQARVIIEGHLASIREIERH